MQIIWQSSIRTGSIYLLVNIRLKKKCILFLTRIKSCVVISSCSAVSHPASRATKIGRSTSGNWYPVHISAFLSSTFSHYQPQMEVTITLFLHSSLIWCSYGKTHKLKVHHTKMFIACIFQTHRTFVFFLFINNLN